MSSIAICASESPSSVAALIRTAEQDAQLTQMRTSQTHGLDHGRRQAGMVPYRILERIESRKFRRVSVLQERNGPDRIGPCGWQNVHERLASTDTDRLAGEQALMSTGRFADC